MTALRLNYDQLSGIFVMFPTPSNRTATNPTAIDTVDLEETERAVEALISDGVDGLILNGTMGEGPLLLEPEWEAFTALVVTTAAGRVPVVAGATSLNTRETIRRARIASDLGADGLLLGRPMWNQLTDEEALAYYTDVATAVPELGIVVYHNPASFKHRITPPLWRRLADLRQVVGAKYGLVNDEWAECVELVDGALRLMVMERDWAVAAEQRPHHATAAWSIGACGGPVVVTALRDAIRDGHTTRAKQITRSLHGVYEALIPSGDWDRFRTYSMQLEKLRIDSGNYMTVGPTRPPYTELPDDIVACAREAAARWETLAHELAAGAASVSGSAST